MIKKRGRDYSSNNAKVKINDQRAVSFPEFSDQNYGKTGKASCQEPTHMAHAIGIRARVDENVYADHT
jgi:hypothetical protein